MILTDREIEIALTKRQIIIEPMPNLKTALSSTTLDLTLSDIFVEWKPIGGSTLRPGSAEYSYKNLLPLQTKLKQQSYTLNPNSFVLAWTSEEVELPEESRIAARVEGKSSLARLGVGIHVTAPTIHCGFSGNIQLEMFNFGPHCIELDAGMRVCQLIFEQTYGTPIKGYSGIFAGQTNEGLNRPFLYADIFSPIVVCVFNLLAPRFSCHGRLSG
ncbi:dCTP deaminase [Aureimonas glaciei]|uniref:dCTP deaminase n=1 Tax=Aureimonas glaciei TaxID=1776957 RepID=UPI001664BB6B|nr:dCTP deaminase [Aureimonas glaciei]